MVCIAIGDIAYIIRGLSLYLDFSFKIYVDYIKYII